jgi:hypothetical protein
VEEGLGIDELDLNPKTLCAQNHRSSYGTDGDFFSKPQVHHVVHTCLTMLKERRRELSKLYPWENL